jgi:poly-D-alanine transfer protein DltD
LSYNTYINGNAQGNSLYSYLKQTKMPFSKMKNRKVKQVLSGDWYQWEVRGYKERG